MESIDILINIRRIVRSINLESKRIQRDFNISIPQLLCLNYLNKCEEYQSTHRDLTKFLHLNSSTVTGIINRLEKKGLIARLPKKGDKRVTYISLTSNGYEVLEKTPDLLHEKLSRKLSELSNVELEIMEDSLKLLISVLDIKDVEASPLITIEDLNTLEE